jgi:hypothetical protein
MGNILRGRNAARTAGVVLLLLAGSCGDGTTEGQVQSGDGTPSPSAVTGPARAPTTTAADTVPTRYVLLGRPDWQLQEAVDYRAGLGSFGEAEPDLDWYAEYFGPQIDHDDGGFTVPTARVSGHTTGLEAVRARLVGFEFGSEDLGSRRALVAEAANRNPAVAVVELGAGYSVMVLSYDDAVDVRDLAGGLVPADEQQWIAAGGQLLDCVPFEPGCAPGV